MAQDGSTSITRRSVVAGLTVTTVPVAALARPGKAFAQAKQTTPEKVCMIAWVVSSPLPRWSITSATQS
jgi:hypothetical protein